MSRIESMDDTLFTPLTTDQADHVAGGAAAAGATYERYADFGPDGTFLGWGYVQVDQGPVAPT